MKFSDKLAKARKANNLSQEQLADELGVTRQSISKWESGDSYPDMAKIIQLCKVLNCTINDILDDDVVSQIRPEEKNDEVKENKVNAFKKYFDELLNFITKSINMISHMGTKQVLKMILELLILGFILKIVSNLLMSGVETLLWSILGFVPKVHNVVHVIVRPIVRIGEIILSIIIFTYVYKTRYLDYYVMITDNNATKQTVEEPIEENKAADFTNKKKDKVVIIRDPKHSNSKLIDGLVSAIIIICKAIVVMFAIPVIFVTLLAVVGIVICVIKKGIIFKSSILLCLSALIFGVVIIIIFYNLIFNRKQMHRLNIILIVISLLMCGVGCGLLTNNITNIKFQDENTPVETTTKKVVLKDLKENDVINIMTNNSIEYVIDENKDDITLEFTYPVSTSIEEYLIDEEEGSVSYYYEISAYDMFEFRELLNDIEQNTISKSYSLENYLKVKVTCNEANKAKFMNFDY